MNYKLIFFFIICIQSANSQNQLFFVKATTVDDPYIYNVTIPACVYKYERDSMILKQVLPLSSSQLWFKDMSYNYDAKVMVITQEVKKTFEERVFLLKTDKLDTLISFPEICPKNYRYAWYNFIEEENIPYLLLTCGNSDDNKRDYFVGLNLKDLSQKEFNVNDFKHILISGNSHFQYNMTDVVDGNLDEKSGSIQMAIIKTIKPDFSDRPVLPYEIPDSLRPSKKSMIFIYINNKTNLVLNSAKGYMVYNKESKQWFSLNFKGDRTRIYNYGNWLAGTILQSYNKSDSDTIIRKDSPGMDVRKKLNSQNPFNVDERFFDKGIYSPGILYLLNSFTKKYLEIVTNQGDSEVLLVENNVVYYRVNDEIFKRTIINSEKLGEPELMIKSMDALDIHWAFITK